MPRFFWVAQWSGVALAALLSATSLNAAPVWQPSALPAGFRPGPADIRPLQARHFKIDPAALQALTNQLQGPRATSGVLLNLPMPDGRTLNFRVHATEVMPAGLAARFPQIRTFAGSADGAPEVQGRFDLSPRGLRGMILSPQGRIFIDPLRRGDAVRHQVYWSRDLPARLRAPDRVIPNPDTAFAEATRQAATAVGGPRIGRKLTTYRLGLATTGEYALFHDPSASPSNKTLVMAELVTLLNRVSGITERELAMRFQLVENNDALIFTQPETDPYSNDDLGAAINQNQVTLDSLLGPDAYDIGHVLATAGGGGAALGGLCDASSKALAGTGLPNPVGDSFYVDYVAHEMGHQLGAEHTFNTANAECGPYRWASSAYEPGSGSTIMSYAGLCGEDNLQPHSDAYFHAGSLVEIRRHQTGPVGSTCGAVTASGNKPPKVTVRKGGFTIPAGTPFELTGSAEDPDGDPLVYQWEQMDLGAGGHPNEPDATAPLFRSFPATSNPTRVFPQLSDILSGTQTLGEILPAVSRPLTFRFTARDQKAAPSAGGVASADLSFQVSAAAGPFSVPVPTAGSVHAAGGSMLVQWDVANTLAAPVSCTRLDIRLSVDGGNNFPYLLASKVFNGGGTTVALPAVPTAQGRLKLSCSNNVFFAISPGNFTLR